MIFGRMRRAATGGNRLGDQAVHLFPAFATQANNELVRLLGIREGLVDQRLEQGFGRQHGLDGALDNMHERRIFAAESGVEGKAERRKEGLGFFEILHGQVEDDLLLHGGSLRWVDGCR